MKSYKLASRSIHTNRHVENRSGAALAEVLISLLITAIGLVGIASLFPISVLRAVQATKITKATFLRNNVEELIQFDSRMIHDPDGDGDFSEHNLTNYIIDPFGHHQLDLEPATLMTDQPGSFGGGLLPRMGLGSLLDPNTTDKTVADGNLVADFVTLPDTWISNAEDFLNVAPNATSLIVVPGTGFADGIINLVPPAIPSIADPPSRINLVLPDGSRSASRMIDSILTDPITGEKVIQWTGPLPDGISGRLRVILESQEYRYTWMLTVRKQPGSIVAPATTVPRFGWFVTSPDSQNGVFQPDPTLGTASVDVVVFYNRAFTQTDEIPYNLTPVQTGHGDEVGRQFEVTWDVGNRPAIRKGGYMLDPDNARWYRIVKIEKETDTSALILFDTKQPGSDTTVIHQGIFMKGVVEVFPLGDK